MKYNKSLTYLTKQNYEEPDRPEAVGDIKQISTNSRSKTSVKKSDNEVVVNRFC